METVEENNPNNNTAVNKKIRLNNIEELEQNGSQINHQIYASSIQEFTEQFNFNGNEDCTEKIVTNSTSNVEEPMDLTFTQKNTIKCEIENSINGVQKTQLSDNQIFGEVKSNASITIAKLVHADQLVLNTITPKKRGRKRKDITNKINNVSTYLQSYHNNEFVQMDSRQGEVLMAAKSLFSKRTRTLYHWMYPNTPKAQLKSAVSMSWETLGVQEKEFYISQVLGRFGFPQSSLMVNPQLGGLRGVPVLPPLDLSTPAHLNIETQTAVSTILNDQDHSNNAVSVPNWPQYSYPTVKKVTKRRGRIGRPPGSKTQKSKENIDVKPFAIENIQEDFQNDPELRKEFEQFKWALRMTEK